MEDVTQALILLDQEDNTLRGHCDTNNDVIAQLMFEILHKVIKSNK